MSGSAVLQVQEVRGQVVEETLMGEVIKTRGTRVFANTNVFILRSHQLPGASELIVMNLFLPRGRPSNVDNQRLI